MPTLTPTLAAKLDKFACFYFDPRRNAWVVTRGTSDEEICPPFPGRASQKACAEFVRKFNVAALNS